MLGLDDALSADGPDDTVTGQPDDPRSTGSTVDRDRDDRRDRSAAPPAPTFGNDGVGPTMPGMGMGLGYGLDPVQTAPGGTDPGSATVIGDGRRTEDPNRVAGPSPVDAFSGSRLPGTIGLADGPEAVSPTPDRPRARGIRRTRRRPFGRASAADAGVLGRGRAGQRWIRARPDIWSP